MIDSSVLHFLACVSTTLEYSKDTNGFLCLTGVSRSMLRPSDKAKKALHSSYFCLTAFLVSKSSHLGCSCQVPNQIHNYHFFFFFRGENAVAMITKKSRKVKTKCLGRKKKRHQCVKKCILYGFNYKLEKDTTLLPTTQLHLLVVGCIGKTEKGTLILAPSSLGIGCIPLAQY